MSSELTAPQIAQLGELLIPMFRESLRPEFEALRNQLTEAIATSAADAEKGRKVLESRLAAAEQRIAALEQTKWRVALSYGAVVAVVTAAWHAARAVEWRKLLGAFGGGQ